MQRDIWLGQPKAALRFRRHKHDDKISLRGHRLCWRPSLEEEYDGTGGSDTVKSGSTLQSLTALSVGDAEFYAVVKGDQVGLSLRSMYQGMGMPMKIEIQSDSSTANSLTDRLGARQRTKHIDTRYFWIQERVQDGDFGIKNVPTAKNCAEVGTKPASASVPQQHCLFAGLVFY